ncbi:transcriptional regulator [Halobacteriales archaeon QS_9_68_42]|nr:MAG: transcriptional regulator [Halobacteriales archaeon QS_9_68_42]
MSDRLPTGIDVLDRKLNGGIPPGSIVALCAQPASQAELFLYELTATRGTLYLSLNRTGEFVSNSIDNAETSTGDPTVRDVTGEAPLDNTTKLVSALPEESNLIVDPVDTLDEGDRIENRLAVPKFRGGRAMSDVIKLELSDEVEIDTSRDIA